MIGAPVGQGAPCRAFRVEVLYADVEFADATEPEVVGGFELVAGVLVGEDGGKADEAVGSVGDPLGDGLIVPAAGVFVFPVPAEEDGALYAVGIHGVEHILRIGPVLNAGLPGGCDEFGPMRFIAGGGPGAGVLPEFGGEDVGVGVNYVVVGHGLRRMFAGLQLAVLGVLAKP